MAGNRQNANASRARRRTMQKMRGQVAHDPAVKAGAAERAELKLKEEKLLLVERAEAAGVPLQPEDAEDVPPLAAAVAAGDAAGVAELAESGADLESGVRIATRLGDVTLFPMDLALHGEQPDVVAALLDAGVAVDSHWLVGSWLHAYVSMYPAATALTFQMQVGKRFTPIGVQRAVEARHPRYLDVTRVLLEHGGDPNAVDDYEKTSPLRKAVKFKLNDLADVLRGS